MSLIFDLTQELTFHNIDYILHAFVANEDVLVIEAEQKDSGERWTSQFTAAEVEKMCHKTGNFKKFSVFIKMLSTAMLQETESVFIDILTYADLEMLKAQKTGQPVQQQRGQNSQRKKSNKKRYVILTYVVEFDRVHYPLPLKFETESTPQALKQTISRLRNDLTEARYASSSSSSHNANHNQASVTSSNGKKQMTNPYKIEVIQLQEENKKLKLRLMQQGNRRSSNTADQDTIQALQEEIYTLTLHAQDRDKRMRKGGLVDGRTVARKMKELERQLFQSATTLRKEKALGKKLLNSAKRENTQLSRKMEQAARSERSYKEANEKLKMQIKELRQQLKQERQAGNGRTTGRRGSSGSSSRPGTPQRSSTPQRSFSRSSSRSSLNSSRNNSRNTNRRRRATTPSGNSSRSRAKRPASASSVRSRTPVNRNRARTPSRGSAGKAKSVYGATRPLIRSSSARRARSNSTGRRTPVQKQKRNNTTNNNNNNNSSRSRSRTGNRKASTARRSGSPAWGQRNSSPRQPRRKTVPKQHQQQQQQQHRVSAREQAYLESMNAESLSRARNSRSTRQQENMAALEADSLNASKDIADIDTRINKLQMFLKAAKGGVDMDGFM